MIACGSDDDASSGASPDAGSGGRQSVGNIFVDRVPYENGCLARTLSESQPYLLLEVRFPTGECSCDDSQGRTAPTTEFHDAAASRLRSLSECDVPDSPSCDSVCVCVLEPVAEDVLEECRDQPTMPADSIGWCYINGIDGIGDPAVIPDCAEGHGFRFLGPSAPAADAQLLVALYAG